MGKGKGKGKQGCKIFRTQATRQGGRFLRIDYTRRDSHFFVKFIMILHRIRIKMIKKKRVGWEERKRLTGVPCSICIERKKE
jgi:hypothetical protein